MATEATHQPMPPGILVRAPRQDIERTFFALVPLQPTRWTSEGLICAPRAAPEIAARALASCPLRLEPLDYVPGWPSPPSLMVSGWYRRSTRHAVGPDGSPELIQSEGDGFGPLGHPTTAMCLAAMSHLPAAPALDAGCGSGLLAQAWATITAMSVLAIDADPGAVEHTRASVTDAQLTDTISVRRAQITALEPHEIDDRVILANVPAPAHTALLARVSQTPPGAILSGLTTADWRPVVQEWTDRGMRLASAARRGRWHCFSLVAR